jgi:hypothetical protein
MGFAAVIKRRNEMKKCLFIAVMIAFRLGSVLYARREQTPTARDIVEKIDELYRSDSSKALMEMEINTPQWQRTLKMRSEDYLPVWQKYYDEKGELAREMFRVSGLFHFNTQGMDKGMIFIRLGKAQDMLNIADGFHEIAVQFQNIQDSMEPGLFFWKRFSRWGNEAVSWTEVLPQLKAVFEMTAISSGFPAGFRG